MTFHGGRRLIWEDLSSTCHAQCCLAEPQSTRDMGWAGGGELGLRGGLTGVYSTCRRGNHPCLWRAGLVPGAAEMSLWGGGEFFWCGGWGEAGRMALTSSGGLVLFWGCR